MTFSAKHPTEYPGDGTALLLRVNPWSPVFFVVKFFRRTRNKRDRQIVIMNRPPNSRSEMFERKTGSALLKFCPVDAPVTSRF
jgi:hypothetical protein